jgi:hypothetical protein
MMKGMWQANNGKYYDIYRFDFLLNGTIVATSREVKDDCKDPAHAYDYTLRLVKKLGQIT